MVGKILSIELLEEGIQEKPEFRVLPNTKSVASRRMGVKQKVFAKGC